MRFSQKVTKLRDQAHTKKNSLRKGALLGVILDIHWVRTNLEDPVDVGNEPQQGIHLQGVGSKKNFVSA